jgi:hypothetical protein
MVELGVWWLPGKEGGGLDDALEEKDGNWMMDSMGGDRKETWTELVLRGG